MRALKILVVVMGVMIVAGVVTLAMVIAQRLAGAAGGGFTERSVEVPAGARVIGAAPGEGRLALTLEMPDGSVRIELIDLRTGKSTGALAIAPAAPR